MKIPFSKSLSFLQWKLCQRCRPVILTGEFVRAEDAIHALSNAISHGVNDIRAPESKGKFFAHFKV